VFVAEQEQQQEHKHRIGSRNEQQQQQQQQYLVAKVCHRRHNLREHFLLEECFLSGEDDDVLNE
jgi:hypothetical protein